MVTNRAYRNDNLTTLIDVRLGATVLDSFSYMSSLRGSSKPRGAMAVELRLVIVMQVPRNARPHERQLRETQDAWFVGQHGTSTLACTTA
jgi:hypothetical protein